MQEKVVPGEKEPSAPLSDAWSGQGLDTALCLSDTTTNTGQRQAALAWQGLTQGVLLGAL